MVIERLQRSMTVESFPGCEDVDMAEVVAPPTLVLVHGAFHGAWCWAKVTQLLDAAGIATVEVELPLTDFAGDVATTTAAIESAGGPVVLVGHSYGGSVITQAGNHPAVRHLVYLCAIASDTDGTIAGSMAANASPTGLVAGFRMAEDQTITIDRDIARACFYHDCDPAEAEAALDMLRPIASACFGGVVTTAAWRERPSTYVRCTDDRALDPELQRHYASRCTNVVEWPTSHSPFISRPELVVNLFVALAGATRASAE
jgi:pimeloyl-ACP methyl ester carboxylesterase